MKGYGLNLWVRSEYRGPSLTSLDKGVALTLELWQDLHARDIFKVCWLVETQLREMREAGYTRESARKELTDIVIICVREMVAQGFDPGRLLLWRLEDRHRGQIEEIYQKYEQMFLDEFGPALKAVERTMERKKETLE